MKDKATRTTQRKQAAVLNSHASATRNACLGGFPIEQNIKKTIELPHNECPFPVRVHFVGTGRRRREQTTRTHETRKDDIYIIVRLGAECPAIVLQR